MSTPELPDPPELRRPGDRGGRVYQLTDATVSPTRNSGSDEDGIPREETICVYSHHELFVDLDGNLMDVPMSNSRVHSGTDVEERYGMQLKAEWIRKGGLPIAMCPYARDSEVKRIKGTSSLVPVPKDAPKDFACEGKPDGCEHLHAIRKQRLEKARKKFEKQESQTANAKQMEMLARSFGAGFAEANNAANAAGRKAALRAGEGEKG